MRKTGFKKDLPSLPPCKFVLFILLIRNHTFFLAQLGINLHLWVFQEAEIGLTEAACAISAFLKTHLCKLIPNYMEADEGQAQNIF